jgi:hypothetical protein
MGGVWVGLFPKWASESGKWQAPDFSKIVISVRRQCPIKNVSKEFLFFKGLLGKVHQKWSYTVKKIKIRKEPVAK